MKYINTKDFVNEGYLQEINRVVLHPLGLALEVRVEPDGEKFTITRVQDYRHDPEGIIFDKLSKDKLYSIRREEKKRFKPRMDRLGYIIQED